jgi:peroxiredoxin
MHSALFGTGFLLLASRLGLSAVFVAAGVAKLADRAGVTSTLLEFRLPARLALPAAVALPAAELAVAVLLVPAATARVGAAAACALLAVFCVAIAAALRRGERPDCACFGRAASQPVGARTLVRNAVLVGLAGLVVGAGPGQSLAAVGRPPVWVAGLALAAAQAWLWFALLSRYGRALRRIASLEAGTRPTPVAVGHEAPAFTLPDVEGRQVSLAELVAPSRNALILFTHAGCGACDGVLRQAASRQDVIVVSGGDPAAGAAKAEGLETVLLDEERHASSGYGVTGFPTAVLLDGDGRVARAPAVGAPAVAALLDATASPPDALLFELVGGSAA